MKLFVNDTSEREFDEQDVWEWNSAEADCIVTLGLGQSYCDFTGVKWRRVQ